ncbi:uncharacterized protein LOC144101140 [Amblyomma americanum]
MLLIAAMLLLLFYGGQCTNPSQNFFADNLLDFVPRDSFPLQDLGFEVDVLNDTVLHVFPFELVNGTAWRFRRRVQRQGDCRKAWSAGTVTITCALSFTGLMARYDLETMVPGGEGRHLQFFVREGLGEMEITATRGRPTQLTAFHLYSLKMAMKEMDSVLVHPDVDEVFTAKATENVEMTMWEALAISYAGMLRDMLASISPGSAIGG